MLSKLDVNRNRIYFRLSDVVWEFDEMHKAQFGMKFYLTQRGLIVQRARRMRRDWYGPFDTAEQARRYGLANGFKPKHEAHSGKKQGSSNE